MIAENQRSRLDIPSWLQFTIMIELSLDTRIFSWYMNLLLHFNKIQLTREQLHLTHGDVVTKEALMFQFISQRIYSTIMKLLMLT
jgi:hypothetical protein